MLQIDLLQSGPQRLLAKGAIVDLRKCGFVPMAGELQDAGLIHHMELELQIDAETRVVERVDVAQPAVAFEASEASGGECCRDPAPRLLGLRGERLDSRFAKSASRIFGGALGCSHLLTLTQTMGRALPFVLDRERALQARRSDDDLPRQEGERIAKRSVFVDGLESGPMGRAGLDLVIQQSDLHTRPRAEVGAPLDRLHAQEEVRAAAHVAIDRLEICSLEARQRGRSASELASAEWHVADDLGDLLGRRIIPGLGGELLRRFGDDPERRLLLDALLHLAPGFIQCVAALTDNWVGRSVSPPAYAGTGGSSDACYMWRGDGGFAAWRRSMAERGSASPASAKGAARE